MATSSVSHNKPLSEFQKFLLDRKLATEKNTRVQRNMGNASESSLDILWMRSDD